MKRVFLFALSALMLVSAGSFANGIDSLKKAKSKAKTAVNKTKDAAANAATEKVSKTKAAADQKVTDTKAAATQKAADTKAGATEKVTAAKTATTKKVTEGVNKSADKAIGKDAQGRTIYLGPKGGQYTLSESGKKAYLKTADKIKVK